MSCSKNNNGNVVVTDKTNDFNITYRIKKTKKYNKIDNNNNSSNNNSSSNNNEDNNNNESSNNNKVNSTPSSHFGDTLVKKLNGFLLTRKLNHKCLVKVGPFNSAKVRCMHDHAKPAI